MTKDDVREIRKRLGYTQAEFAALLGVKTLSAWTWENRRDPTDQVATLVRHFYALKLIEKVVHQQREGELDLETALDQIESVLDQTFPQKPGVPKIEGGGDE